MSRVELLPVPLAVARAAVTGEELDAVLGAHGLVRAPGWPHDDTADALRPLAEHGTGEGTFLVVRRADRAVVGDCGWFGPPRADGTVEIGYGLAASARGQGLAAEAVGLLLDWVAGQPDVTTVTAEVLVGNEPSLRLLHRLGFDELRREGDYRVLGRGTARP